MPSVIVSWEGTCAKPAIQRDLTQRLVPIADHFDRFLIPNYSLTTFRNLTPSRPCYLATSSAPALELRSTFPRSPRPRPEEAGEPLSQPRLNGIQFKLAGPGFFYPGEDVVSFVFLSAEGIPEGKLVQVRWERDRMLLLRPEVHLRYSLETWFDYLLAGIKHFYIPDLAYWRHTANPGYAKWTGVSRTPPQADAFWRKVAAGLNRAS